VGSAADFDFWLGDWRAEWADGGVGSNSISKTCGGRVVLERFAALAPEAIAGLSVSVFDPETDLWRQTWVDSTGGYIDLVGGPDDEGVMTLRHEREVDGAPMHFRMRFENVSPRGFDWLWDGSRDEQAWEPRWTIAYSRI
jgi:hypothetical protein